MPKIRKKTSRRQSTHQREKVKRKVSEAHRKGKKLAKKDPTWRSNKPKELGVPSKAPFKEQVLAEAAAEKARLEREKLERREAMKAATNPTLASTAALASAMAAQSDNMTLMEDDDDEMDDGEALVQDPSVKLHARSLRKVLELSDVIIEVLDARDPVGTRCKAVERELKSLDGGRKKLVIVLNKIDLVPQNVVQSWLAYLRTQAPTLPFKSSTQQQRKHLSSAANAPSSAAGSSVKPLMELIKGFRLTPSSAASTSTAKVNASLTIGVIGHPNVGKSSLINTMKRSKACSVAPTPGWTKEVQEITLEKGIRVLDCPGVVVESRSETEGALRGVVKPEDLSDLRAPIELMLERCKKQHLMMLYNIPMFTTTVEFLIEVARAKGRLRKGGVPDLDGTARSIVRDWTAGRISYYVPPPALPASNGTTTAATNGNAPSKLGTVSAEDVGSASIQSSLAPAFDLEALFGEADQAAFDGLPQNGTGAGNGVAVKMQGVEDDDNADIGWMAEEEEEQQAIDVADLIEEDGDVLEDDDAEDEEAEVEDDVEMDDAPQVNGKKRGAPPSAVVSVAPKRAKSKRVSFASEPLGPTGSSQHAKMFAQDDVEAPAALNKNVKKAAKKDKKKAAKAERKAMEVVDNEMNDDDDELDVPAGPPRKATVVRGNIGDAYDFSEFFPQESNAPAL